MNSRQTGQKRQKKSSRPKAPISVPELLYYGRHICQAIASCRKQEVVRVYCTDSVRPQFGSLLQWCARQKKAYHIVSSEELVRITGSVHHEGVAILARAPQVGTLKDLLKALQQRPEPIVFLDGVQNPHNIGTIMRAMASFGWRFLVGGADLPPLTAAAARISEGGAEWVSLFKEVDFKQSCQALKQLGYTFIGSSSHAKQALFQDPLPVRSVIVLGGEVEGISRGVLGELDRYLAIPSTARVESLNVAVACALFLGEYTRIHGIPELPT